MNNPKTWYSNGLTEKKAKELERVIVRISNPEYQVGLSFAECHPLYRKPYLEFKLNCINTTSSVLNKIHQLTKETDIASILTDTKASAVSKLEGKTIIAYLEKYSNNIKGISVCGYLELSDVKL